VYSTIWILQQFFACRQIIKRWLETQSKKAIVLKHQYNLTIHYQVNT